MTSQDDKDIEASVRRVGVLFEDCPARGGGKFHVWNFRTCQCDLCLRAWPYEDGPCGHRMWDWDLWGDRCPTCGKRMRP